MLDEVIPQAVERFGADGRRVAIGGISMGGFGAFDIARRRPSAFCAVGGHSAALWLHARRHRARRLRRRRGLLAATTSSASPGRAAARRGATPACGWTAAPPIRSASRTSALAAALHIRMRHWPGGHDGAYWHRHYARYLRFYAAALAAC